MVGGQQVRDRGRVADADHHGQIGAADGQVVEQADQGRPVVVPGQDVGMVEQENRRLGAGQLAQLPAQVRVVAQSR